MPCKPHGGTAFQTKHTRDHWHPRLPLRAPWPALVRLGSLPGAPLQAGGQPPALRAAGRSAGDESPQRWIPWGRLHFSSTVEGGFSRKVILLQRSFQDLKWVTPPPPAPQLPQFIIPLRIRVPEVSPVPVPPGLSVLGFQPPDPKCLVGGLCQLTLLGSRDSRLSSNWEFFSHYSPVPRTRFLPSLPLFFWNSLMRVFVSCALWLVACAVVFFRAVRLRCWQEGAAVHGPLVLWWARRGGPCTWGELCVLVNSGPGPRASPVCLSRPHTCTRGQTTPRGRLGLRVSPQAALLRSARCSALSQKCFPLPPAAWARGDFAATPGAASGVELTERGAPPPGAGRLQVLTPRLALPSPAAALGPTEAAAGGRRPGHVCPSVLTARRGGLGP